MKCKHCKNPTRGYYGGVPCCPPCLRIFKLIEHKKEFEKKNGRKYFPKGTFSQINLEENEHGNNM